MKPEIAKELGISDHVKVAAGAGDNAAAAVGTGTVGDGMCNLSLGTAEPSLFLPTSSAWTRTTPSFLRSRGRPLSPDGLHALSGFLQQVVMMRSSGTGDYSGEQAKIQKLGENHVFFLPYLMGERSPHNDPAARGTFIGMTMDTTRTDMTQAVLEGVAFALRDSFEVAKSLGIKIERTRSAAAAPRALCEEDDRNIFGIKVDVMRVRKDPPWRRHAGCGACGEYPDVVAAAESIVKVCGHGGAGSGAGGEITMPGMSSSERFTHCEGAVPSDQLKKFPYFSKKVYNRDKEVLHMEIKKITDPALKNTGRIIKDVDFPDWWRR